MELAEEKKTTNKYMHGTIENVQKKPVMNGVLHKPVTAFQIDASPFLPLGLCTPQAHPLGHLPPDTPRLALFTAGPLLKLT